MAGFESQTKKSTAAGGKLAPVAVGVELQEHIKDLEKQLAKQKEKNQQLEQEMLATKKSLSLAQTVAVESKQSKFDDELLVELESLRREKKKMTVGSAKHRKS